MSMTNPGPLDPQARYFATLNAKDEVALDLLAAMYAFHPQGEALFAAMEKRKLDHSYGEGPLADGMEAETQRNLTAFKGRMDEIRASIKL